MDDKSATIAKIADQHQIGDVETLWWILSGNDTGNARANLGDDPVAASELSSAAGHAFACYARVVTGKIPCRTGLLPSHSPL
ncbi:hypothetical protein [Nocardia fluminea]|uniref:hypothetical protein n=1 Tax=Nocardia fluminea TaxID=134984 RepID=UPI0033E682F4